MSKGRVETFAAVTVSAVLDLLNLLAKTSDFSVLLTKSFRFCTAHFTFCTVQRAERNSLSFAINSALYSSPVHTHTPIEWQKQEHKLQTHTLFTF